MQKNLIDIIDHSNLRQLREELKRRKHSPSGLKNDLSKRLKEDLLNEIKESINSNVFYVKIFGNTIKIESVVTNHNDSNDKLSSPSSKSTNNQQQQNEKLNGMDVGVSTENDLTYKEEKMISIPVHYKKKLLLKYTSSKEVNNE